MYKKTNGLSQRGKTLYLVQISMLSAIIILMTIVPFLGYIPLGIMTATIIHIPVIIGAIVLGPLAGAILGSVFGVSCLINAFIKPPSPLDALLFQDPLVSVLPRILIGIIAALVFRWIYKKIKNQTIAALGAAILGSLTNTIFVLGAVYIFHKDIGAQYFTVDISGLFKTLLFVIGTNGVIEAIVAAIITTAIAKALFAANKSLLK